MDCSENEHSLVGVHQEAAVFCASRGKLTVEGIFEACLHMRWNEVVSYRLQLGVCGIFFFFLEKVFGML